MEERGAQAEGGNRQGGGGLGGRWGGGLSPPPPYHDRARHAEDPFRQDHAPRAGGDLEQRGCRRYLNAGQSRNRRRHSKDEVVDRVGGRILLEKRDGARRSDPSFCSYLEKTEPMEWSNVSGYCCQGSPRMKRLCAGWWRQTQASTRSATSTARLLTCLIVSRWRLSASPRLSRTSIGARRKLSGSRSSGLLWKKNC